ncbi:MAG: serine/threonine protein kinase [Planctomycetaceae bacterium]|nr:serine/threonine protein kinase [Planctomycetaceae bacterium]
MSLHLTSETASRAWDDLAQRLERFIATWDGGGEPTLAEFLPAEPPSHRRFVLVELIKVDLEQRTAKGKEKRLPDYVVEYPELIEQKTGEPSCDLIYEEFHIRRGAGQAVTLSEYCMRYPKSAAALKRLMGTEGVSVTTQMFSPAKKVVGVTAGQKLDDFELIVELGKGAFASVYLAKQVSMQRLVALKVSADKGNEPRTLATLDHPNIVRVFDQRQLPQQRLRLLYMQFAPGGTLSDVVNRVRETPPPVRTGAMLMVSVGEAMQKAGQLPPEDSTWRRRMSAAPWPETVCRMGTQLAQALDHAHKQGVLHRDVKPANVLLSSDAAPKLADFNISFSSQIEGATPAAYFGGSAAYMSPEQLEACNPDHERRPEDLDGRSDLYSLAVLLWELLYGERPFADEEMSGVWSRDLDKMVKLRRSEQPYRPPGIADPVTMRLEQVLTKALAPERDDRQPDGSALAREIALCLNPRAWDLVNDLGTGWRKFALQHPLWSLVAVNLPPFLLAGGFNFWYNRATFINNQPDTTRFAFHVTAGFVNGLLYPIGIALVFTYIWSMARTVSRVARNEPVPQPELVDARRRSMLAGHVIALVSLFLWVIAGFTFPTVLWLTVTGFPVGEGYARFVPAMVLCGLISCCFPFLATTWMCIRMFFPSLLVKASPEPQEQRQLIALSKQASWYFVMSVVVPFLALVLALFSGPDGRNPTVVLIAASVAGFFAAFATYNRIRSDLAALTIATRPADMVGTVTDSVDF